MGTEEYDWKIQGDCVVEEVGKRVVIVGCIGVGSGNRTRIGLVEFAKICFLAGMEKETVNGILKDIS